MSDARVSMGLYAGWLAALFLFLGFVRLGFLILVTQDVQVVFYFAAVSVVAAVVLCLALIAMLSFVIVVRQMSW